MLVLSRKKNERIIIGGNITLTVIEIRGDKVRLGLDAPEEISIHRFEVLERIRRGEPRKRLQVAEAATDEQPEAIEQPEAEPEQPEAIEQSQPAGAPA